MTVVDLYSIQIIGDSDAGELLIVPSRLFEWIKETEENLTDLLPPGYRARIQRWDNPDEGTDNE